MSVNAEAVIVLKLHCSAKSNGLSKMISPKVGFGQIAEVDFNDDLVDALCENYGVNGGAGVADILPHSLSMTSGQLDSVNFPQTPRSRVLTEMRYFSPPQPDFEFITIFVWHSQHALCQVCSDLANEGLAHTGYK